MKDFDFQLERVDDGVILKETKSVKMTAVGLENRIYGIQMEMKSTLDRVERMKKEYKALAMQKREMEEMLQTLMSEQDLGSAFDFDTIE